MDENKNDVTVVRGLSPAEVIMQAVKSDTDLEKLAKAMELQERFEATQAKKAYHVAMAAFKSNPPKINKDKSVAYKEVRYSHASLANVTEKINAELSKHGLSAAWTTKQNGQVEVTCKITHAQGHSEETTLKAGADSTGSKNSIQAIGSTITYLQRYTILALTGLATSDQDDDGKISEGEEGFITADQATHIKNMLEFSGANKMKLLSYLNAAKVEDILAKDYNRAIKGIEDHQARNGK